MKSFLVCAMTPIVFSAGLSLAEAPDTIDICHYTEEDGSWEVISIYEEEVDEHLNRHAQDVIKPSAGETARTSRGRFLNDQCNEVE